MAIGLAESPTIQGLFARSAKSRFFSLPIWIAYSFERMKRRGFSMNSPDCHFITVENIPQANSHKESSIQRGSKFLEVGVSVNPLTPYQVPLFSID